jgi:ribonuclease R
MADSKTVRGTLGVHPRGFGFLNVEALGEPLSVFVPPPELNPFFAGDRVEGVLTQGADGRWSAGNLRLLERERQRVFGELVSRRGQTFLRVDREVANTDWPLELAGQTVAAEEPLVARIDGERLVFERKVEARDAPLERILVRHGVERERSPGEAEAALALRSRAHAAGGRRDLRGIPTVTVDAASTRDIDDAISVLPADADGALRLMVSIADVSEWVTEGSLLDSSARERGTSVYLPGEVVPMLPESLSANWLSLLPGEDRLCLTVELRLDPEGRVLASDVYESVIRSWARLDYDGVARYLETGALGPGMESVRKAMPWFRAADARLAVARRARGGLQIESDETHFTFDERGELQGLEDLHITPAHALIERFMVAANEAVAGFLLARGVPSLFRVHPVPEPERVAELSLFAAHSGFAAGFGPSLTPLALAAFERQIAGAPVEAAVRSVLRRSLGPSVYAPVCAPHFGLASAHYLHFTSPIRRYADLSVHRTLKAYLRGRRDFAQELPALEALAAKVNLRSRSAARAERDRHRMLEATLLATRTGEAFEAHVTRVKPFGLTVQLDRMRVEGVVASDALGPGPWRAEARETRLVGPDQTYVIGAPLTVRVAATDARLGRIELVPVQGA